MKARVRHPFRNSILALAILSFPLQGRGGLELLLCYAPMIIGAAIVNAFSHAIVGEDVIAFRSVEGVGVQGRSGELRDVDCEGVTNEFADLYDGDVLKSPRLYAETLDGGLSEADFAALPREGLRLPSALAGNGIGLVRTTEGNDAKFLFEWVDGEDEQRFVRLREVTVTHPTSGEKVHYVEGPADLPPRVAIDLDPPDAGGPTETSQGHDLMYAPDEAGVPLLVPREGATLSVPTRSLCP